MLVNVATLFCLAAAAAAIPAIPYAKLSHAEPHYPAQYEYEYSVHDDHNGDIKHQKENRNGDAVHGFYSLVQPDGVRRIVEYTVDKEHGFNAVVRYEGHPKVSHEASIAKVAYTAPVPKVTYAAPVAKVAYAQAPVVYNAAPVANYANPAPIAYAPATVAKIAFAPQIGYVSYSSPSFSYHH